MCVLVWSETTRSILWRLTILFFLKEYALEAKFRKTMHLKIKINNTFLKYILRTLNFFLSWKQCIWNTRVSKMSPNLGNSSKILWVGLKIILIGFNLNQLSLNTFQKNLQLSQFNLNFSTCFNTLYID